MAYTAERAVMAIRGSKGFVTTIATRLGCSVATVYNLIKRFPTVAEALDHERETMLDFAESKLLKLIDAENVTAIIFFLKTQGKKRGYIEKQEVDSHSEVIVKEESPIAKIASRLAGIAESERERTDTEESDRVRGSGSAL